MHNNSFQKCAMIEDNYITSDIAYFSIPDGYSHFCVDRHFFKSYLEFDCRSDIEALDFFKWLESCDNII